MERIILNEIAEGEEEEKLGAENQKTNKNARSPVHVVYGGAHLFKAETPQKLGRLALKSLDAYSPNFVELAQAVWLSGADTLSPYPDVISDLESQLTKDEQKAKTENYNAWFAWTVYRRTIEKLKTEAVEDFRIDFEDGYGFRTDEEEDGHAVSASDELARAFLSVPTAVAGGSNAENPTINVQPSAATDCRDLCLPPFCGFRIKSFAPETYRRAARTLDLFLNNLLDKTGGRLPENFVVTLPKITDKSEIKQLRKLLEDFENERNLPEGAIKIEIMVETPRSIITEKGKIALPKFIKEGKGRVSSAHFGAYDYTASLGISGIHQHLRHDACNFARQMMLASLAPLGIRLSDSVTTEMPIPIHKGENLSDKQLKENKLAVHKAWRAHFNNVTHSLINGFYQSWDLHPAQLVARYAAVYAFFLESADEQARRLKGFIEKATQAMTTGNTFDDAASAQGLVNFFIRALNCGAMREEEILEKTGLEIGELRSASFQQIMENRR